MRSSCWLSCSGSESLIHKNTVIVKPLHLCSNSHCETSSGFCNPSLLTAFDCEPDEKSRTALLLTQSTAPTELINRRGKVRVYLVPSCHKRQIKLVILGDQSANYSTFFILGLIYVKMLQICIFSIKNKKVIFLFCQFCGIFFIVLEEKVWILLNFQFHKICSFYT